MSQATWYTGDALTVLKTLPDASVDLVMTSPPFLALRSYLPADDPNKALEIGSEATPGEFLDVLLDVVVELRRVLAPHGSLVVELGDTYSGSGGAGGDYGEGGWREGQPKFQQADGDQGRPRYKPGGGPLNRGGGLVPFKGGNGWPLAKSLCMVPSSFAFALAYGRNPWTGRTLEPWRVRNLIAWCRPNPPVGALGDKFRPGTSYLTVACTGASRYFDLDAVRELPNPNTHARTAKGVESRPNDCKTSPDGNRASLAIQHESAGAPPLDWWEIPTHPYPGSHYATFPPQLCVRPIKAMCPQRVCRFCGKPSERITSDPTYVNDDGTERDCLDETWRHGRVGLSGDALQKAGHLTRVAETVGWSDCGHDDWRAGVVLDCFAGSGTTGEVATGHGRDFVGVDLDPRNYELARQRIGMFLTEAEPREAA